MKAKDDLKLDQCWVTHGQIGFGLTIFACYSPTTFGPVGLLWGHLFGPGNSGKQRFEILGCYVPLWARRRGVMTKMQNYLFCTMEIDALTTQQGSREGGERFLTATSWTLSDSTGFWTLPRPVLEK